MFDIKLPSHEQFAGAETAQVPFDIVLRGVETIPSERRPERNEDAFYTGSHAFVVCDGVGSHQKAEGARAVADIIGTTLDEAGATCASKEEAEQLMADALEKAHTAARECASPTTVTAAFFWSDGTTPQVTIGNVADSEAFLLREGNLSLLSWGEEDQLDKNDRYRRMLSFLGMQAIDQAQLASMITESPGMNAPGYAGDAPTQAAFYFQTRHVIKGALGYDAQPPEAVVNTFPLQPADVLALLTDGNIDPLTSGEIQKILETGGNAHDIIEAAVNTRWEERRKMDDRTAIVIDCRAR